MKCKKLSRMNDNGSDNVNFKVILIALATLMRGVPVTSQQLTDTAYRWHFHNIKAAAVEKILDYTQLQKKNS